MAVEVFDVDAVFPYLPYLSILGGLFLLGWLTHQGRELKAERRALELDLAAIYAPTPEDNPGRAS